MRRLATSMPGGRSRPTGCRRTYRGAAAPAAMPTSIATSSRCALGRSRLQPRNEFHGVLTADRLEVGGVEPELLQVLHLAEPEIRIVRAIGDLRGRYELWQRRDRGRAGGIGGV